METSGARVRESGPCGSLRSPNGLQSAHGDDIYVVQAPAGIKPDGEAPHEFDVRSRRLARVRTTHGGFSTRPTRTSPWRARSDVRSGSRGSVLQAAASRRIDTTDVRLASSTMHAPILFAWGNDWSEKSG